MKFKKIALLTLAALPLITLASCGEKTKKISPSGVDVSSDVAQSSQAASSQNIASSENVVSSSSETITNYTREENKIYFGAYPQTKVEATTSNGLSSIKFDASTWTSYEYYIDSTQQDFMYYKDVDIDNNGTLDYRGVYFTKYRPYNYSSASNADNTYQYNNNYRTGKTYWFSYDPIEWDILEEEDGKLLIISNLILDSQEYYPSYSKSTFTHNGATGYANNYELSNIRIFLNDTFYNTAFNDLQKALIEKTTVDNSSSTTSKNPNKYACNNTNDKLFLLSYQDAYSVYYSTNNERRGNTTEYAKCQGIYFESYTGTSSWWLRSPIVNNKAFNAFYVSFDGGIQEFPDNSYIQSSPVGDTNIGVRPVCWIKL